MKASLSLAPPTPAANYLIANAKHMLLSDPNLPKSPSFHGVLVIEAKGSNAVPLETHIPQVVAEMLACAKIQE